MKRTLSRREMLKRAAVAGAIGAVPQHVLGQPAPEPFKSLSAAEGRTLEAIVARLIPSESQSPGALEAGAARYIDRALGDALAASRPAYTAGLAALDAYASASSSGKPFAELDASRQDALLRELEQNVATGFTPSASAFFELVLGHTLEGTFSDPYYGGNRDFIGWQLIGYPGLRLAVLPDEQRMDAKNPMVRLSAYDLPMFDKNAEHEDDHHGR